MKFYGTGVVWNPKTNSRLCRFVDGSCEVTDTNEIAFLVRAGYKHDAIDYNDNLEVEEQEVMPVVKPVTRRKKNASN